MNAGDALARLAAFGLPGAHGTPITIDSLDELVELADARHALSWVSDAVAAGMVSNETPEFLQALRARHLTVVTTTMAAHAVAHHTIERLRQAGWTDVRVLKGCATGHLDYARPTDRYSSDVDLLLSTGDQMMLAELFPDCVVPAPRRRHWQDRYGKSTTIIDEHGVELDLHMTLAEGYFGLVIPPAELRRHVESFTIAGTEMVAFDGSGRLLHAAVHAGASNVNLNSLRDVLQLLLITGVDWNEAIDRGRRWKIDSLMALGIRRTYDAFDVEPHPLLDWAKLHRPSGRQSLALRLAGDRPHGLLLTTPLALPVHRWPGYVLPILLPSREYLVENEFKPAQRTKRLLNEVVTLLRTK